jgi:outer membrane receptor protein involved in Fe transport
MNANCKRTLLASAVALTLGASISAWAQDAQTGQDEKPGSTSQQPADGSSQPTKLATIIVTAEKRSEDVQNVPMSIDVIDESQLDTLHINQFSDLAGYVPGLVLINSGGAPGQASLSLRGIAPPGGTGAAVATYIDETPFGTSGLYGRGSSEMLDMLPYDFQSVEVLRGPQGTLYGANAFGGVVRYVSKQPDLDSASFRVGADVFAQSHADDLGVGGHVSFNVPLVTDRLALSVSLAQQNSPGFTDNARTGKKDQDAFWQRAAHAMLLWKASDDLSVKFSVFDARSDADSSQYTALDPLTFKPIYGNFIDDNYVPESYKAADRYYNATVNWNLGFADFVSSSSYAQTDTRTVTDASDVYGVIFPALGLPDVGVSAVDYHIKLDKGTQEFRLVSKPDDHLEWLLGAFWTRENTKQNQVASAQFLDYTPIPGLDPLETAGLPSTYKEYAGFGDLTYKFTSAFDISAGVRWAHNDQTFTPIAGGALAGGASYEPEKSSENVLTYSFSPRLHFGTDSMLYLRVASGYAPGGPNLVLDLPGVDIPPSVDSSKLTNYELGVKSTLDDDRLTLNAAMFDIEWDRIQITEQADGIGYLANAGSARSKGLEASALYMPLPGLRIGFNGAYTDAKLTQDAPTLGLRNGQRLPSVPQWTGSAIMDYGFPLGGGWSGRVGGGLRYVGATKSAPAYNDIPLSQDGYTALDLNADVSNDRWTLRIFVKNLLDKRAYTTLTALPNALTGEVVKVNGVPLAPRTIGIGFDYWF